MKKKVSSGKKPILMAAIKEEQKQVQLKEAYGITEDVKVVEKKSTVAQVLRVIVSALFHIVRCVATVAIILLAIIGVATLVYPNMRAAGLSTWLEIKAQFSEYLCK